MPPHFYLQKKKRSKQLLFVSLIICKTFMAVDNVSFAVGMLIHIIYEAFQERIAVFLNANQKFFLRLLQVRIYIQVLYHHEGPVCCIITLPGCKQRHGSTTHLAKMCEQHHPWNTITNYPGCISHISLICTELWQMCSSATKQNKAVETHVSYLNTMECLLLCCFQLYFHCMSLLVAEDCNFR